MVDVIIDVKNYVDVKRWKLPKLLNPLCVESLEGVLWGEVEGLKRELFR